MSVKINNVTVPLCANCRKCRCHFSSKDEYCTSICEEFGQIEFHVFSFMGCKEYKPIFREEDFEVAD